MEIIEGTLEGKSLRSGTRFSVGYPDSNYFYNEDYGRVRMISNLKSADIVSEEKSNTTTTSTGGGITGAGAGAVLGFLIAGPLGTAVGAGLGSRSKSQTKTTGRDNITIALTFANGDAWVVDRVTTREISKLKVAISQFNEEYYLNPQLIRQEPPPEYPTPEPVKGRKKKDTKKLPKLPILKEWSNIENLDKRVFDSFKKNLIDVLQKYNNYKWVYFGKTIESDKEVVFLAEVILKNFYTLAPLRNSLEMELVGIEDTLMNLDKKLNAQDSKKKDYKLELSKSGFFSKGKIKDKIKIVERDISIIKNQITTTKKLKAKKLKTNKNQLKKIKDLEGIDDLSQEIELIFNSIFPKKKLNKRLKKPKSETSNTFFLKQYRKAFKEIEDKRLITEEAKIEKNKKVNKEVKHDNSTNKKTKSTKERLIDLKNLFDEDLITKKEYEEQRKNLISGI
jgi:hypothetical protein